MLFVAGKQTIDGAGGAPSPGGVLVNDKGIIEAVGVVGDVGSDVSVIELSDMTLLPGLIDCHIHLFGLRLPEQTGDAFLSEGHRAARGVADVLALLRSGFTTVRDCGSHTALALRDAINEGSIPGPRIIAAGRFVERTGGADDPAHLPPEVARYGGLGPHVRAADGPWEVRRAVREQVRAGSDFIKTCSSGPIHSLSGSPFTLEWSVEELEALVDEAHRLGRRVAAHAKDPAGIRQAVEAGADTIEHGTFMDQPTAKLLADRQIPLVPTLSWFHVLDQRGETAGAPDWLIARARTWMQDRDKAFEAALQEGVPIALGTDCGGESFFSHGENGLELELMVDGGATPMQTILAATANAARALGLEASVGRLRPGLAADIIGVTEDPLDDIKSLRHVQFVMKAGQVVVDPRGALAT